MKSKSVIFGLLILMMMSSCIVYHPMVTDIPLISQKKEVRIDAGISAVASANATISYGLTDKIAIQGFGSVETDDMYYFQAATGYYKNIGNNKVFEIYSGFGYGYGNAYKDANLGYLYGHYQLYFIQTNYGKIASKKSNFETGFGLKTGYLKSSLTDKNFYDRISENGSFKTYHDKSLLFEPVGFIRFGGDKFRINIKLGRTQIFKFTNTDKRLPYSRWNLGIGLNYKL